jgi:hypothetical protein
MAEKTSSTFDPRERLRQRAAQSASAHRDRLLRLLEGNAGCEVSEPADTGTLAGGEVGAILSGAPAVVPPAGVPAGTNGTTGENPPSPAILDDAGELPGGGNVIGHHLAADADRCRAIDEEVERLQKIYLDRMEYEKEHPAEGDEYERRAEAYMRLAAKLCAIDDEKRLNLILCIGGCYGKTLPQVAAECWQRDGEYWRCPECSAA